MKRERGNAAVEFALSCLLIMTVLVMSVRFGYSLYTYNKLEGLVNAGARYASRLTYDSTTETPSQSFRTAVSNMVVYGNLRGEPGRWSPVCLPPISQWPRSWRTVSRSV
jgi:Flp pilus assembly protein TadG